MKNLFLINLVLLFFFLLPIKQDVYAHVGIPFVNINGKRTVPNTILAGSSFFKIANELAPENYLVGQSLTFTVDPKLMPVSPDQVGQAGFTWDFGDQSKGTTLSLSHRYSKTGSYIVILSAKDPASGMDFELESVKVNIVPSKNYTLPKAVIKVNDKVITDPTKDVIKINSGQTLTLDGSKTKGKIKTFLWDFGDGSETAKEIKVDHTFKFGTLTYSFTFFPILRVSDENGLVDDTYVQLSGNKDQFAVNSTSKTDKDKTNPRNTSNLPLIILGAGVLVIIVSLVSLKRVSKNK
jgi:hypothetical protein